MFDLFDLIESGIWLARRWSGRLMLLAVVVCFAGAIWLGLPWGLPIVLFVVIWLFGLFASSAETGRKRRSDSVS